MRWKLGYSRGHAVEWRLAKSLIVGHRIGELNDDSRMMDEGDIHCGP